MVQSELAVKAEELSERLASEGVEEEDLVERFVRASGSGGQKVNKTAVAVYLKHLPSGIEVKVQDSRSQAANRLLARELLLQRLVQRREERERQRVQRRAKLQRQRRPRPPAVKRRILADKRKQAEKKRRRRRVKSDQE